MSQWQWPNVGSRSLQVYGKWGVILLCLLQMWYLVLEIYRHWHVMGSNSRVLCVPYLVMYPLVGLNLVKKNPNPVVCTILVYIALGAANFLIFPLAR